MDKLKLTSISIPAISTGNFGCPYDECANAFMDATIDYLSKNKTNIDNIRIILFDNKSA